MTVDGGGIAVGSLWDHNVRACDASCRGANIVYLLVLPPTPALQAASVALCKRFRRCKLHQSPSVQCLVFTVTYSLHRRWRCKLPPSPPCRRVKSPVEPCPTTTLQRKGFRNGLKIRRKCMVCHHLQPFVKARLSAFHKHAHGT